MGTTDGSCIPGSRRKLALLAGVVLLCFTALAIALSGPDSAVAKRTDDRNAERKKGKQDAALPVEQPRFVTAPEGGQPGAANSPADGDSRAFTAYRISATKVRSSVATFKLRGVPAKSIRSAHVRQGRRQGRLRVSRVRAAVRRGVLRVRTAEARASSHRSRRAGISKKRKKPVLIIVTEPPAPTPAPTPTPEPAPSPEPASSWRAPRSLPLSDATAKSLVVPRPENRPGNTLANHYLATQSELYAFHNAVYGAGPNAGSRADAYNPLVKYVTGGFTGTTDEILQWGAHKWGIPADVLRAVAVNESSWRQDAMGDRRDGVDASRYPARSVIDSDSVYESLGLTQIKWRADGSLNPGTEPLRWKSTAFNVDYAGAFVRYYYDGYCTWCNPGYAAGQAWESIGAHYQPSPWRNAGMLAYITHVQEHLAARTWAQPGF